MEQFVKQVQAYLPCNAQESADLEQMLLWLRRDCTIISRENRAAHLTASAWVVNPARTHVLMAYHNLFNSWAWLGGHADGDWNLRAVAAREATEESGITSVQPLGCGIGSVEILTVDGHEKRGQYVPSHLHLNVTYLFEADFDAALQNKPDENSAVDWICMDEISQKSSEPWLIQRIYPKLIAKSKQL